MSPESNPCIQADSVPQSSMRKNKDKVKDALGKWGEKAAEATKKAEYLTGNMRQHSADKFNVNYNTTELCNCSHSILDDYDGGRDNKCEFCTMFQMDGSEQICVKQFNFG